MPKKPKPASKPSPAKKPGKAICENCTREIDADEAQMCDLCGRDGLGNCCVSALDHGCPVE